MTTLGKRALTDESLAEELMYAKLKMPERARNGIKLGSRCSLAVLTETITAISGGGRNVKLLVLTPDGELITK